MLAEESHKYYDIIIRKGNTVFYKKMEPTLRIEM